MKRFVVSLAALLLLAAASLVFTHHATPPAGAQAGKTKIRKKAHPVKDQYIVVLEEWAAQPFGENSFAQHVAEDIARAHGGRLKHVYKHALLGFSVSLTEEQAERLTDDPRVAYVEEDGVVKASTTQTNPPWGLDRIDQRNRPLDAKYLHAELQERARTADVGGPGFLEGQRELGRRRAMEYVRHAVRQLRVHGGGEVDAPCRPGSAPGGRAESTAGYATPQENAGAAP